jgi:Virulence-associated protein E
LLGVNKEWFSHNLPLGLPAKEAIEILSGRWIVEVGELQGMRRGEIEKVKAFMSRDTDRARMAYDRTTTDARRQNVIVGTTNCEQYLRDLTGNRRFWPVRIERFDLKALERDRDQLWAEAAEREASGASIHLPERLYAAASVEQQERVIENPFISVLDRLLRHNSDDPNDYGEPMDGMIAVEDAWTIVGVRPERRTQDNIEKLGDAMRQLGWERDRLRVGAGKRSYVYTRGPKPYRRISVNILSGGEVNVYYEEFRPKPREGSPTY